MAHSIHESWPIDHEPPLSPQDPEPTEPQPQRMTWRGEDYEAVIGACRDCQAKTNDGCAGCPRAPGTIWALA